MQSIKLELKYSLYGLVVGAMAMIISHGLCFAIAAIDIHHILSALAITAVVLLVCSFIGKILQTSELTRYLQKKVYCLVFFLSALWSGAVYWVFFAPSVVDVLASVSSTIYQFVLLFLSGTIFICLFCILSKNKEEKIDDVNIYLSDQEVEKSEDDRFFEGQVKQFANDLEMYSSPVVFGIEGPWGIGKSSFSNLCCEQLKKDLNNKLVIYKFNPLSYDDIDKVLKNFYTGLIAAIKKKYFEPEVEALLESYMEKVISALSEQSIQFIKIKITRPTTGTEQIMKKLEKSLANLDYQIFIVIDDLDRLDFINIKKILFLMRNIFSFPNLIFIVCYDMQAILQSAKVNLLGENIDEQWVMEFISKYINYTYRIYLETSSIIQFTRQYADRLLQNQSPRGMDFWGPCTDAVNKICEDEHFSKYQRFLGTPRRIKILFQQILRISNNIQYQNTIEDFSGLDIIHLLLIYIYYPNDFRKIYDLETRGESGIYSYSPAREKIDDHIDRLDKLVKKLPNGEKHLFEQLFMQKDILKDHRKNQKRACFNDEMNFAFRFGNRSLTRYLQLITLSEVPEKNDRYSTYTEILRNKILLCHTVADVEAAFSNYLDIREDLWSVIVFFLNESSVVNQISNGLLEALAQAAANQLPEYKLTSDLISFHTKLIVYIRIFLNELAKRTENQVIKAIFNETGVLHRLLYQNPENYSLLMNVFDALYFKGIIDIRTEGNDIFPLNDALIHAKEPKKSLTGMNTEEMAKSELREISQCIYHAFKENFGDRNLWHEFNNLPLGNIVEFSSEIPQSQLEVEQKVALFTFKSFILYQIGSIKEGLAGYDLRGNGDGLEIRCDFSEYLNDYCFTVSRIHDEACFDFMEFMLISILGNDSFFIVKLKNLRVNDNEQSTISPQILTTLMYPPILKSYWRRNRDIIMSSSVFDGKFFYVNADTIVDARLVADYIGHSLDYWTSDEQAAQWNSLL
ncbi:P-loop NTPase fold protein [uncultured Megasphaera sp.]|uniref:P-loop NTPase fold protein n=1 Tax=uncultured Megasphaera sp. TaxID=165188 RepID=UPI00266F6519|nr:P-loop NTPase fold protein [uncultured Megasphaera sp.]